MRRKSEIQTAVKAQSGGVNEGLARPWYQFDTDALVIAPPIVDTPRLSATQKANPQMSRPLDPHRATDGALLFCFNDGQRPDTAGPVANADH